MTDQRMDGYGHGYGHGYSYVLRFTDWVYLAWSLGWVWIGLGTSRRAIYTLSPFSLFIFLFWFVEVLKISHHRTCSLSCLVCAGVEREVSLDRWMITRQDTYRAGRIASHRIITLLQSLLHAASTLRRGGLKVVCYIHEDMPLSIFPISGRILAGNVRRDAWDEGGYIMSDS
jgi:hypothetical protein